jgi:RNA polymerase subunit RPABC4/transcription elongation factor Spt4
MSCTRCGAAIAPGAKVCPACGWSVPPERSGMAVAVAPPPSAGGAMRGYEAPVSPLDAPAPVEQVVPTKTNAFAIVATVMGALWYFWLGSILALIFGYIAKGQIDASQGEQKGRGWAIAGIVLGWIGIGTLTLSIIALIVIKTK